MDYSWKHYLEDLRNGKTEIKLEKEDMAAAGFFIYQMGKDRQGQAEKLIKWLLSDYRDGDRGKNAITECLVKAHADCCRRFPGNGTAKKCHNALVYRYMMKTALHNRAVALKMDVSESMVHHYIAAAIKELAVLCFGTPVFTGSSSTWQDAARQMLDNLHFLECMPDTSIALVWDKWQQERVYCHQITESAVAFIYKALSMYEEYISGSSNQYIQKRALDIVKEVYITGGKGITEISSIWGISIHSVYLDIRKVTARLGELCSYMAGRGEAEYGKVKND